MEEHGRSHGSTKERHHQGLLPVERTCEISEIYESIGLHKNTADSFLLCLHEMCFCPGHCALISVYTMWDSATNTHAQSEWSVFIFLRTGVRGTRLLPESLWKHSSKVRVVKELETLRAASYSLYPSHLSFAHVVSQNASVYSLCDAERTHYNLNNPLKAGWIKKLICAFDHLTMKPVLVLLVSTAWTFTGAQYYYQGLMDYLENRLLAIEVRNDWQTGSVCSFSCIQQQHT